MAALKGVNTTGTVRLHIHTINRETQLKYKNHRRLTFPGEVICTIKKLKIKKRFRGCRGWGRRKWEKNMGIHFNVLRMLPTKTIYKDTKNLVIGTTNCCSVNKKTMELLGALHHKNYDICFLTETWIKKDDPRVVSKLEATSFK